MLTKNMIETRYGIQLLENLVKLEQSMYEVELDASATVSIPDNKQLVISVAGKQYVGELDRPLIHKLATSVRRQPIWGH